MDLVGGRYQIVRQIGAGGMGVVYLVEDTRHDHALMALKTRIRKGDGESSEDFRAEFRNIHGVVHPNIPQVYDFGVLAEPEDALYFTSEFVEGKPLDSLQSEWSPEQLRMILVSLCRALAFLHSRSLLHRDIKPQNVLAQLGPDGVLTTIKLVDFGLSSNVRHRTDGVSGTIEYLAPELVNGESPSAATDLYALGMLMYRLATGRLPFDESDALALARIRTQQEAPSPLRYRADLPVGLTDVINQLLRMRAEDRPQSARHVIALLNEREGSSFPYETAETRSAYLRSAESVTNQCARERLNVYVNLVRGGVSAPNVAILGSPGLGRKRLINEFATELSLCGVTSKVINSDTDLQDIPPGSVRAFLVPEMRRVSLALLIERFLQGRYSGEWWVVGADEADAEPTAMLMDVEAIRLVPLDLDGVRRLIDTMLPQNTFPPEFAEDLYVRSLGLAAAAQDILHQLLNAEQLTIGLHGWELLPGPWPQIVHPDVAAHIDSHILMLSAESRVLMEELACSVSPVPYQVMINLAQIARHSEPYIHEGLPELLRMKWVEESPAGYSLTMAAVAEHVRTGIPRATRCALHRSLAAAWGHDNMAEHPHQKWEVVFHEFSGAEWRTSASKAHTVLSEATNEGHTAWVRHLVETGLANDPPREVRLVLLRALGEIEFIEANLGAAADCFDEVLDHGRIAVTRGNIPAFARYAMIQEKLGNTQHAEDVLRRCLPLLNQDADPDTGAVYGTLAWIMFKKGDEEQASRLAEEGLTRVPPKTEDLGMALLLNTVATLAFYKGDLDAANIAWTRCLEVYEHIGDRKGIANMYNNLGVSAAQSGDRLKARSLWEKSEVIAREISDMHRLAGIYNNLGIDALETGELAQAEEYYTKALTMFRRLKSSRDEVELLSNLGELAYYRADYTRAQAYWNESLKIATTAADRECQIEPLVYMGKLLTVLEDLEHAKPVFESARDLARELSIKKGEGQAWEGLSYIFARFGDAAQSAEALRNAYSVLTEDVDPLACLHLHLTACGIAAEDGDQDAVRATLADARKVADTKWDPFTAARTLVYGLLFAGEAIDPLDRARLLRQLSLYPDLLWRFHWACARRMAADGGIRHALDEYGRGIRVLKSISSRLSDEHRASYLDSPQVLQFKSETLALRQRLESE